MSEKERPIYLDYNATTPHDPEVVTAMRPFLETEFGNPSSSHAYGERPRSAVAKARVEVAALINAPPEQILFTSGGTESNNYAIIGAARALRNRGDHVITSTVEHPAAANACDYLEREGFVVTRVPVDRYGMVDPKDIEKAIRPGTENVLEIVGLSAACRIAARDLARNAKRMRRTRDLLHEKLAAAFEVRLNGHTDKRLPNTLNVGFRGVASNDLIDAIARTVAVSAGSACHADSVTLSPVIEAIGTPLDWGRGTIRFSTGKLTTDEEVDQAAEAVIGAYQELVANT